MWVALLAARRLGITTVTALLAHLRPSDYLKAIGTLSAGRLVAAIIPLLAAPILGRIFLPQDYALVALFTAITALLFPLSTLQLQFAIVAETNDNRAADVATLSLFAVLAAAVLALLIGLFIVLFTEWMDNFPGSSLWLLALPISTALTGKTAIHQALANRREKYFYMALTQGLSATVASILSIGLGLLGTGTNGLMIAMLSSQVITVVAYLRLTRREAIGLMQTPSIRLRAVGRKYREYPKFSLPSALINLLMRQLPILAMTSLNAADLLGAYRRADQLAGIPATLLGTSISQVFRRRAATDYHQTGSCRPLVVKTVSLCLAVGLPVYGSLWFFGPELFALYLGENWSVAGELAQLLAPLLLLRLCSQCTSSVFQFTGRQRFAFKLNLLYGSMLTTACLIPIICNEAPAAKVIEYFVTCFSALTAVHLVCIYFVSGTPPKSKSTFVPPSLAR